MTDLLTKQFTTGWPNSFTYYTRSKSNERKRLRNCRNCNTQSTSAVQQINGTDHKDGNAVWRLVAFCEALVGWILANKVRISSIIFHNYDFKGNNNA